MVEINFYILQISNQQKSRPNFEFKHSNHPLPQMRNGNNKRIKFSASLISTLWKLLMKENSKETKSQ